jgi:CubicO group peptidase (beta-lactamase class C family)
MPRYLLTTILCCLLAAVATAQDQVVVKSGLGERINTILRDMEQEGFSGTCLVATGGEVVLAQGYGWANREEKIPTTVDTVFDIGSITKQFTGAAVLKLAEQGKLSVSDPLSKYIDGIPEEKQNITLHHLLTHSANLRDSVGGDYMPITEAETVEKAFRFPNRYDPGTLYRYSNVGYTLLGMVIEKVTGASYEAYLRETFFDPLEMDDTGYVLPEWKPDQLAHGYYPNNDWGTPRDQAWDEDGPYWNLRANGGILSNVWDMYRWHVALENESALSEDSLEKLFHPHIPEGRNAKTYYGYGWSIQTTKRDTTLVAHNGGNGIFFADFWRYIEEDSVIIIMTNAAYLFDDTGFRLLVEALTESFEGATKE